MKTSMKTSEIADLILKRFAGTHAFDKVRAVRAFCNSDSVFVMWAKKTPLSFTAIRNARLLQLAWKRLGLARALLITLKAIKAVIAHMLVAHEIARFRKDEAIRLLDTSKSASPRARKASFDGEAPMVSGLLFT